jgi:hypothetical protein
MAKQARRSIAGDIQVLVCGVLALLTGRGTAVLAKMDHKHELDSNRQLRESAPEHQEQHLQDSLKSVNNRVSVLRRHFVISTLWLATAVYAAIETETMFKEYADSPYLGIWSALAFAVATLGRLGWASQSWSADTTIERLDRGIFWFLYWLGMYMAAWAVYP